MPICTLESAKKIKDAFYAFFVVSSNVFNDWIWRLFFSSYHTSTNVLFLILQIQSKKSWYKHFFLPRLDHFFRIHIMLQRHTNQTATYPSHKKAHSLRSKEQERWIKKHTNYFHIWEATGQQQYHRTKYVSLYVLLAWIYSNALNNRIAAWMFEYFYMYACAAYIW